MNPSFLGVTTSFCGVFNRYFENLTQHTIQLSPLFFTLFSLTQSTFTISMLNVDEKGRESISIKEIENYI